MSSPSPINDLLLSIAAEAAVLIRQVYRTAFRVDYKGPSDPVTDADRNANELICRRLQAEFPGIPIVAEESPPEHFAHYTHFDQIFFVDPLDGTREFVDRNGEFVVMIGMVEGDHATAGVIYAPELDLAWVGGRNYGAFLVDRNGCQTPIRVSNTDKLENAHIVSSRSHRSAELERALQLLNARTITSLGSAGLKGAAVAESKADAYVAPHYAGKRWDACAADALVTAAGGQFSDTTGAIFNYRDPNLGNDRGIIASNGILHADILRNLQTNLNPRE